VTEEQVSAMNHFIRALRSMRATYEIPPKTKTEVFVINTDKSLEPVLKEDAVVLCALSSSKTITLIQSKEECPPGCVAAVVNDKCTAYLLLKGLIDLSKEEERIKKQIDARTVLLKKIVDAAEQPEYSTKVPMEVQEQNNEKAKTLTGEMKELIKAMDAVKIMLSE